LSGVVVVLAALALVVAASLAGRQASPARLADVASPDGGVYGVLQSAGLLFFALAGYARIATMGEEVRNPQRTIPRAITLALGIAVAVYAAVGTSTLLALGPARLASSAAPLTAAVRPGTWDWAVPAVAVGGAAAALGALLALIAVIGRTTPGHGPQQRRRSAPFLPLAAGDRSAVGCALLCRDAALDVGRVRAGGAGCRDHPASLAAWARLADDVSFQLACFSNAAR
jgi:amino acid transporter